MFQVNILLFFAGISVLAVLQACFILVLLRNFRASIAAEAARLESRLKAAQDKIYSDVGAFFVPAGDGEPSEFGKVVAAMADTMASTLFMKLKNSAIGSKGGSAERNGQGSLDMGDMDIPGVPPVVGLLLKRFLGGGAPAPGAARDNGNGHSPKFSL